MEACINIHGRMYKYTSQRENTAVFARRHAFGCKYAVFWRLAYNADSQLVCLSCHQKATVPVCGKAFPMPRNRLFRHMIYAFLTHETACSVVRKMPFQPEKGIGRLRRRYNMPSGETYGRIVNGLSACPFFCFMIF